MLNKLNRLTIKANGLIIPTIENYSMVMIDKLSFFELGIINFNDEDLEIYNFGIVSDYNKEFSIKIRIDIPKDLDIENVYLLNFDVKKEIFKHLKFNIIDINNKENYDSVILIDSGMILYGNVVNHNFISNTGLKNYNFIKALFYDLIEVYNGEYFNKNSQVLLNLPNILIEKAL